MNVRYILIAAIVCLVSPTTLIAQEGWYFGMEIGPAIAPGMRIDESDNDWSTQCDLINNPEQVEVGEGSCVNAPPPGAWYNDIEGASGAMGGLTVGYTFKHIRIEGESSFRTVNYGGSVPMIIGDVTTQEKENNELEVAEGGVGDVYTFRLGANALFHRGPFYAGGGVGIVAVGLDRHSRWKRNDDPAQIATFDDPIMKARIAGTTSISNQRLQDALVGYQLIAGYDHALNEQVAIGLKIRWTKLSKFEDGAHFTQLRSHESSVGRGFDVRYRTTTNDLSAVGLTLTMKYLL